MNTSNHNRKIVIEQRRTRIANMLAKNSNVTQTEIAAEINCDQSTVSDDIRVLKNQAQRWLFDLAQSDLIFQFKQSIDGIEQVKAQCWEIYSSKGEELSVKDRVSALRLVVDCSVEKFKLLSSGPMILSMKALEDRLARIESVATNIGRSS